VRAIRPKHRCVWIPTRPVVSHGFEQSVSAEVPVAHFAGLGLNPLQLKYPPGKIRSIGDAAVGAIHRVCWLSRTEPPGAAPSVAGAGDYEIGSSLFPLAGQAFAVRCAGTQIPHADDVKQIVQFLIRLTAGESHPDRCGNDDQYHDLNDFPPLACINLFLRWLYKPGPVNTIRAVALQLQKPSGEERGLVIPNEGRAMRHDAFGSTTRRDRDRLPRVNSVSSP